MIYCWSCGKATGINGRPARSDDCPHCRVELRSCRGCRFFEEKASGGCSEPKAEPPVEKERANFCDFFVAAANGPENAASRTGGPRKDTVTTARSLLDDLFSDGRGG